MKLFSFASKNLENIYTGIEHQLWAVATLSNLSSRKGRETKAHRYMEVGAKGLLYCNSTQSFTTPFIVKSKPHMTDVVTNIWPEAWILPFKIETFGDPSKQISGDIASQRWDVIKKNMKHRGGVSAAMNLTGTCVFVPKDISTEDWKQICEDLATKSYQSTLTD